MYFFFCLFCLFVFLCLFFCLFSLFLYFLSFFLFFFCLDIFCIFFFCIFCPFVFFFFFFFFHVTTTQIFVVQFCIFCLFLSFWSLLRVGILSLVCFSVRPPPPCWDTKYHSLRNSCDVVKQLTICTVLQYSTVQFVAVIDQFPNHVRSFFRSFS